MVGRHNKRGFKRFNNSRNHQQRPQNTSRDYRRQNQLSETEVGITEYISDLEGFSGIIKARFSDFQVNEIDLAGNIAKLTDTSIPKDFDTPKEPKTNYKEVIDSPIEFIKQEDWNSIKDLVESSNNESIKVNVNEFTKEDRTKVHECIKNVFGKKIAVNTITEENVKFMEFKKCDKNAPADLRNQWPADKPDFVHFILYKEAVDTMEAAMKISDCLRVPTTSFAYAGVKDKRAKCSQWLSVRRVPPWKLIIKTKPLRNIKIGNMTFKDVPLKLGQLNGNKFRIALRNITGSDDLIEKSLTFLKEHGFINYYGLQRFGNDKDAPTFTIGVNLLLGKWKEAVDLILKFKEGDDPMLDITKAKKVYNETGSAKDALEQFDNNKNISIEYKLLLGLSQSGQNDYVTALEKIPRNMRLLYLHAFQSLIWNGMVSERVKKFGLKPVEGDLVLVDETDGTHVEMNVDEGTLAEEDNETEEIKCKQKVRALTAEEVENCSIYDVVLPLPGYDVKYPDHMFESYKKALEEYDLDLHMPKQKVKTYTLSGSYRRIVSQVKDLEWKVMKYNNPTDNLIQSDFEELRGFAKPQSVENGLYRALVVEFVLSASSYATMVLREILKQDTSTSAHAKMNDYHTKAPKITVAEPTEEAKYSLIDSGASSLLADAEKYNEFKNKVFNIVNEPPKRKCEEDDSKGEKKVKSN